jgi:SpoVK/Ycf46/Vps4 family AAA+-type ATPase
LIQACFTGLWVETHEPDEALAELAQLCHAEHWQLASWDVEAGLNIASSADGTSGTGQDPLAAIRALSSLAQPQGTTLLVLQNFHRFLGSAEVVQALARQILTGKQARTFIVVLAPLVNIPVELEKLFVVIEHELPDRVQLQQIAQGVATEVGELPAGPDLERLLDATLGLTRYEAEAAFSLSLVRHNQLRPEVLWEQKSQLLKKQGQLALHRGGETFADLGGLESLKAFCLRALRRQAHENTLLRPRGVLLLSPAGCGKSAFCKSLGNETGRPTLTLDVGSLLGSLVGESERNLRQSLRIVDAMAPCILFVDELEKGLAGVNGSGDSGVSARLFGTLLTWLNDHTSDVFFVGTCNDISRLPPEFARAERFDGVVFIDLPTAAQKQQIWQLYLAKFGLDPRQALPADDQWTGAEIRACCRLAALLDVPLVAAAQNVVPVAVTAAESVERLRTWASGRCLSADQPGIYRHHAETARRKVTRNKIDPLSN